MVVVDMLLFVAGSCYSNFHQHSGHYFVVADKVAGSSVVGHYKVDKLVVLDFAGYFVPDYNFLEGKQDGCILEGDFPGFVGA